MAKYPRSAYVPIRNGLLPVSGGHRIRLGNSANKSAERAGMHRKNSQTLFQSLKPAVLAAAVFSTMPGWVSTASAADGEGLASPRLLLAASDAGDDGIGSRDELFGDDADLPKAEAESQAKPAAAGSGIKGYLQFEMARTISEPVHWSKMLTRAELGSQGNLGNGIKWKLGARVDYDAVHDLYDFYPSDVKDDQRFNLYLRENYLDISANDWDFRLGKQNVVWGEMVGLFFADVVSARDMREFILPEFDAMRIPAMGGAGRVFQGRFPRRVVVDSGRQLRRDRRIRRRVLSLSTDAAGRRRDLPQRGHSGTNDCQFKLRLAVVDTEERLGYVRISVQ
jgi:hypothetical protein